MPHRKKIIDTDARFEINPVTREIMNVSTAKKILMQYDHNSERFTFTIPRYIEGHDMLESNRVQVHYTTKSGYQDRVELNDLAELPEDEGKLSCTWLLSQNVTKDIGALKFLLRFACVNNVTGEYDYIWSTGIFSGISVSEGMYNAEGIIEQNPDAFDGVELKSNKVDVIDPDAEYGEEQYATARSVGAIWKSADVCIRELMSTTDTHTEQIGDIETALDNIIAIQNTLIGGGTT